MSNDLNPDPMEKLDKFVEDEDEEDSEDVIFDEDESDD